MSPSPFQGEHVSNTPSPQEFHRFREAGFCTTDQLLTFPVPTSSEREAAKHRLGESFRDFDLVRSGTVTERRKAIGRLCTHFEDQAVTSVVFLPRAWFERMKRDGTYDKQALMNAARIGILKAIERFDYTRENAFTAYATYWIHHEVTCLFDWNSVIHVPVHYQHLWRRYLQEEDRYRLQHGRKPTGKQMASLLGIKPEKLKDIKTNLWRYGSAPPISLDAPIINAEGRPRAWLDILSTEKMSIPRGSSVSDAALDGNPAKQLERMQTAKLLHTEVLSILSERERRCVEKYFGLKNKELSYREIGDLEGVCGERIRAIVKEALKKLRQHVKQELHIQQRTDL